MKDARQVNAELEELLEQLRRELAPTRRQEAGWGTRLRAVALGGLVGGGLALLCAPQAGVVTRRRLRQRGGELQGRASELASQAREQASVVQAQAQQALGQARDRAEPLVATATERRRAVSAEVEEPATTRPAAVPLGPSTAPTAPVEPVATPAVGGRAQPQGRACSPGYPIKGNRSGGGGLLYHPPASRAYDQTIPEECFATEQDAEAADYRRARA